TRQSRSLIFRIVQFSCEVQFDIYSTKSCDLRFLSRTPTTPIDQTIKAEMVAESNTPVAVADVAYSPKKEAGRIFSMLCQLKSELNLPGDLESLAKNVE